MNDPVLNRTLFRHQAQIIHNKIPKYKIGGPPQSPFTATGFQQAASAIPKRNFLKDLAWLASPGKYVKGAKYAYQTAKAARAASKASGKRGTLWGTLPLTKTGKGPRSAWEVFKKKHPKLAATGGIGTAAYFGKIGYEDVREGLKKKDYGQVALGAGFMIPSVGLAAKGIQALRIPGVAGKAAKVSKVFKGKSWKDPRTWGPLGLIGGGALASVMKEDAEAAGATYDLSKFTDKDIKEIEVILNEVVKDVKEITQEHKNKAVEIWEDLKEKKGDQDKSDPDKMPGHPSNIGTEEMLTDEIVPDAGGSTSGEASEILAKQKEMNAETQANVLKNQFDNADMATQREFLKFRQSITDLTGTYGNDRDLIIMKMAAGMMSGKTAHKGLRGLIDVTGKAMGPTVDTALALSNAQKGRDTDLATAFLKMKGEQAEADADQGGTTLKGKQERFIVKDERAPYGYKVLLGQYNKETGQIMEAMGNGQYRVMPGNPTAISVSQAQLQKSRIRASSAAQAHEMAAWVEKYMDDNLKGVGGLIKLRLSDWLSLSDNVTSNSNKYTQGLDTQNYIDVEVFAPDNLSDDMVGLPGFKRSEGELIKEQYYDEQRKIQKDMAKMVDDEGWDLNDSQLAQLTKAALIENRLKYLVANANKQADRLTRWDINNAEKSTQILPFFNLSTGFMPRQVNEKMRALQNEMRATFDRSAKQYQQLGGTNDYLLDFVSIPYIREILELQSREEMDHATVLDTLQTIEIPQTLREGGFVGA